MDKIKFSAEDINSFRAMKRDEIFALLVREAPEAAKGKSRAKKDELLEILQGLTGSETWAERNARADAAIEELEGASAEAAAAMKEAGVSLDQDYAKMLRDGEAGLVTANPAQGSSSPSGLLPREPRLQYLNAAKKIIEDNSDLQVDYSALEVRTAQAIAAESITQPTETSLVGAPEVPGVRYTRREEVLRQLSGLDKDQLALLSRYKDLPPLNRVMRRHRESLSRRIQRFLPKGVEIYEAVAVL
jgi:hypothetical protein